MAGIPQTPFQLGWWSFDLGKYRHCDGTYCFYPYDSLPPITVPDEKLAWLGPLTDTMDQQMDVHRRPEKPTGKIHEIVTQSGALGLTLPDAFMRLMLSRELQDRIPSCTACFFKLGERILPCPGDPNGYIVRFLNDQQDCVLWYLYLNKAGEHCVLAALPELETYADPAHPAEPEMIARVVAATWICAPTFAEFIYRFWLENEIWFRLNESGGGPLDEAEQRYVDFYARKQAQN